MPTRAQPDARPDREADRIWEREDSPLE
jgi:hypothetical protein